MAAMTPPAGAGPGEIVVATSEVCLVDAAPARRPDGGDGVDDLVLRSSFGVAARVLERHGTDRLTRPRSETAGPTPAVSVSLDER
jgi:hypothetical protein